MKTQVQQTKAEQTVQPKAEKQASIASILSGYNGTVQKQSAEEAGPLQKKENRTGLPDGLKSGIENLSGHSMDDVKVHYNSAKPAQLQAHAYAQGSNIHLAPGQEKHLPHEAWHVVQQKQGRVKPTVQMKAVNVNDDSVLEKEADVMGNHAFMQPKNYPHPEAKSGYLPEIYQLFKEGTEDEMEKGRMFEDLLDRFINKKKAVELWQRDKSADEEIAINAEKKIELEALDLSRREILSLKKSVNLTLLEEGYKPLLNLLEDKIPGRDMDLKREGKEIELTSLTFKEKIANGIVLATTDAVEMGLPVLKIETEGADRGSSTIELIYGPLLVNEYKNEYFVSAQQKFFKSCESGTKLMEERIAEYNNLLKGPEKRYELIPLSGGKFETDGEGTKMNIQTNVSIPYSSVGDSKNEIMDDLFKGERTHILFNESRKEANALKALPKSENIRSLLTQILYHDALYANLRMDKSKPREKKDKHHFHVMFKFSVADVVLSLLSYKDVVQLLIWINQDENAKSILTAIHKISEDHYKIKKKLGEIAWKITIKNLRQSLNLRLLHFGKLPFEKVSDKNPESAIEGAAIRHHMPRPSNRIPINESNGISYVVIEQRSSGHYLNQFIPVAPEKDKEGARGAKLKSEKKHTALSSASPARRFVSPPLRPTHQSSVISGRPTFLHTRAVPVIRMHPSVRSSPVSLLPAHCQQSGKPQNSASLHARPLPRMDALVKGRPSGPVSLPLVIGRQPPITLPASAPLVPYRVLTEPTPPPELFPRIEGAKR